MLQQRERGAISLFWCAVLVGVLASAAMAALFSMRYERNLFAEGWNHVTGAVAQSRAVEAVKVAKSADSGIRKCVVNGAVVYSNVECKASDPTSRHVELQDTHGFEAPKVPPSESASASASASTPKTAAAKLQEKMIDKAIGE
jgi:hypothetical protein